MRTVSHPHSTRAGSRTASGAIGSNVRALVWLLAVVGALAVSWRAAGVDVGAVFTARTASETWRFVAALFPPDLSPGFLRTVALAVVQTVATAATATVLSLTAGLPLGTLASARLWRRGTLVEAGSAGAGRRAFAAMSLVARASLGFLRAVPDLLWAILFVTIVGLGPAAGTLALAVAYTGAIGQVYADVLDSVNPGPLEALQSTGGTRVQVFLHGMWPQARPALASYTIYSFECAVRSASVLGLVGAGGIGYEIGVSMRLFEYGQVLTLLLAFVGLQALTDFSSARLRARLASADPRRDRQKARMRSFPVAVALGLAGSFYLSGLTPGVLHQRNILAHAARFVGGMFPPDFSGPFVSSLGYLTLQTAAISLLGTAAGAAVGAVLALPAAATLVLADSESAGRIGRGERAFKRLLFWSARLALNGMRAVPELVWVLVAIVGIGVGPFAGAVALGIHTAGVLGRLYAEAIEEAPRPPVQALYAVGARPLQVFAAGIWPLAKPMLLAYTLLRWEANLRVSTLLGLVGGGGLGQAIYNNTQLGFYDRVSTMILLVYALVMVGDRLGDRLRHHDRQDGTKARR